jgi:hypothetical protein
MKKLLLPLIMAVVGAGVTYVFCQWTMTAEIEKKAGFEAALLRTQLEFIHNNAALRPIVDMEGRPDLQRYLSEVNVLVNWYQKNPVKTLFDAYPDKADPEAVIKEYRQVAATEGARQKAAQGNLPIREEAYKITKEIYDDFKAGTYRAVASNFVGSVRLDAVKVINVDNKLQWRFLAWGGIGELVYSGWNLRWFKKPAHQEIDDYEKEVALAKKKNRPVEMQDPRTLHMAESTSASKAPVLPPFDGSDYIHDFPPGAQINYFVTPTCPPDAEELEMKFMVKARAMAGEDQAMEFIFRMPVDPSWKGSWDGVKTIEAATNY